MLMVENVCKTFGAGAEATLVLDGLTFECGKGAALCLCGPNGSGKTTLLRLLAGLLKPDRGVITWHGELVASSTVRKVLAFATGPEVALYSRLSGLDNLLFAGRLQRLSDATIRHRIASLQARFGLDYLRARVGSYSSGQASLLRVLCAMLHNPELLLMDEPTAFLDLDVRRMLVTLLNERVSAGLALVVATHDEALVAELKAGNLVLDSSRKAVA